MKQSILSRYGRDAEGQVILDVSATRIEDLYNDFDKTAPYIRRDLDQNFADYLVGCARELNHAPFSIRLTLENLPDEARSLRIRRSLNTYFVYLAECEMQKIMRMFRRSFILFAIGFAILFCSVWLNQVLGPVRSMTANVFAEGLTVAAWVSLWEALATFLIEWFPHRKDVAVYRRLAGAKLTFRSTAHVISNPARE